MWMDKKEFWTRYFFTFQVTPNRKVTRIDYRFVMNDCEGTAWLTDLMLQIGRAATGYVPANKEFLQRERDGAGTVIRRKHYNGVIRGKRKIAVPNREEVGREKDLAKRVTGGVDFHLVLTRNTPREGIRFAHQHGQRQLIVSPPLSAGDQVTLSATKRRVEINEQITHEYSGNFHTCPAGFGIYQVELDDERGAERGAGQLVCEVDMWLKGRGGERL
ncbi:hypothetical protein EDC32_102400 [Laceyella sacchari]|nr:hypothetical protein EDC32_102400 [Laceyella sacchari]